MVVPILEKLFSDHGFPDTVKTDNGPFFNGTDSHDFKMYLQWAGVRHLIVALEEPETKGLAENFMKMGSKVCKVALIE